MSGVLGISRDIRGVKNAEEKTRDSEAIYASLIEALPQAIFRKNAEGRYEYFSALSRDITEQRGVDAARRRSEGALRAIVQSSPLAIFAVDADGAVQVWNHACEELFGWTASESIGAPPPPFAKSADELRTPATTVYGLAATLARRQLPPDQVKELQETLHQQAERMSNLVEQLLDMSRLDAASIRISPEPLQLKPELQRIIESSAHGHEAEVEIEAPQQPVVADRAVLERVIGNLVTNAFRYGAPPIRIVAQQDDTHLRVCVHDQGAGIDPAFVPRLFDRFQRSDTARQMGTGAGLGLSIARLYARAHGGDLVYEPVSQGTRFDLVLPT